MNPPGVMLKVIVLVHFILSVWGSMGLALMPQSYVYVHLGVLLCGLWAIAAAESTDAIIMMLAVLAFSVIQDILLLALYEPRGYDAFERGYRPPNQVNEYRFALGMSILNLLLKPLSGFVLYRIYVFRNEDSAFNIPGIDRIPGLGGIGNNEDYENIAGRSGPSYSAVPVESASPHGMMGKE